jgi:hypothetical protein
VESGDDLEDCVRSADLQNSVDRELAAFARVPPSAALFAGARQLGDAMSRNYVRLSFLLLVVGMVMLFFM